MGSSPNYGFGGLPRGNFNAKEGQPPRNDGSICSPVQSNSPKVNIEYCTLFDVLLSFPVST